MRSGPAALGLVAQGVPALRWHRAQVLGSHRPNCVIIDEIDGATGGAEGHSAIAALLRIINGGTKAGAAAAAAAAAAAGAVVVGAGAAAAAVGRRYVHVCLRACACAGTTGVLPLPPLLPP